MRVYHYEDVTNFGDMLNRHIWPKLLSSHLEKKNDVLMMGIGTLIGNKIDHNGEIVIFGSGAGYEGDLSHGLQKVRWDLSFVRGPLTAKLLEKASVQAITDPAIITPDIFAPSSKNNQIVFVPHWETALNPIWRQVCQLAGIVYVDPLAPVENVIKEITSSRLVIAEAMHAAILADAYRVPWVPVATSPRINTFKWQDWCASLEMDMPPFKNLTAQGFSDLVRHITYDDGISQRLFKEVSKTKISYQSSVIESFGIVGVTLRFLYNVLPRNIKYRVGHGWMTKTGPFVDRFICALSKLGIPFPRISKAVKELIDISASVGSLSNPEIQSAKKKLVLDKVEELKAFLDT